MANMKNKFIIIMLMKAVFFSIVLLLTASYKRELDIDIAFIIVGVVSVISVLLYFKNVKKYVLTEKIKQLYNVDIISKELESAKNLIHRGRFSVALIKFKAVLKDAPDNENIKQIITEIEQHLAIKKL